MRLDTKLTKDIQDWLADGNHSVTEGARLLFSINRNRALYNTVLRRPEKYAGKVAYELGKILKIRLDNMTMAEVSELEKEVLPSVRQTLSVDDELPEAKVAKGKRPDHDGLPPEIRALWDDNFTLYRQINLLFEELKALNSARPCDRYDKLQMLAAADRKYRSNLRKYDAYVPGQDSAARPAPLTEVEVKKVNAARKSLSTWRDKYAASDSPEAKENARMKIQRSVDLLVSLGQGFAPETRSFLDSIGISVSSGEA